jgi:hypothetical protein
MGRHGLWVLTARPQGSIECPVRRGHSRPLNDRTWPLTDDRPPRVNYRLEIRGVREVAVSRLSSQSLRHALLALAIINADIRTIATIG